MGYFLLSLISLKLEFCWFLRGSVRAGCTRSLGIRVRHCYGVSQPLPDHHSFVSHLYYDLFSSLVGFVRMSNIYWTRGGSVPVSWGYEVGEEGKKIRVLRGDGRPRGGRLERRVLWLL